MNQLQEIVQQLGQEYGFGSVVLADCSTGLPLVSAPGGLAADKLAAVAVVTQRVAEQTSARLGLGGVNEITLYVQDGQCMVCRWFLVGRHRLILTVLSPPHQAHRRAIGQAIRQIRRAWRFW